jgi:hypothetical protein
MDGSHDDQVDSMEGCGTGGVPHVAAWFDGAEVQEFLCAGKRADKTLRCSDSQNACMNVNALRNSAKYRSEYAWRPRWNVLSWFLDDGRLRDVDQPFSA